MAIFQGSFVAIIGGFWALKENSKEMDEAKKMASEIGEAFANAGLGLVVYFSDDESLEPHVVSGYVKALPLDSPDRCIRVRFAESQKNMVRFAEQLTRSELFDLNLFAGQDWEAPFYRSLAATDGVDGVLLMGGARSTLIAGQIALARSLPILAIARFDGAAGAVRTELAIGARDYPSSSTHNATELIERLKGSLLKRTEQQEQTRLLQTKYLAASSQRYKSVWAATAFIGLLSTVYFGVAQVPTPRFYPFLTFTGLVAAGSTGALVRSMIWGAEETRLATSFLLGGIAGFIVGLAYLIPQWVGAHGVLDPTASGVSATDKIQFVSAVLVAVSAGVGFDTVFTRLKKQAEDQPIGVTVQKR